ncbi:hypothetical protein Clacol_007114 [Clathrus columnatus]|uniref:Cytochrome P450 n=1 Tax=Clathrus columnatus TaxID=1419009 RepID=A0AAV5AJL1_9AGAM|nr:hypothetical protein Clacol_007114 [Clathrus columnatus]
MTYSLPVAIFAILLSLLLISKRAKNRPPGPKGWPVIGNLPQMPKMHEWLTFSEWSKDYGDCIYLTILGQPILVLNSLKAATELLDQRSSIYSSRPRLVMAGDLYSGSVILKVTYGYQTAARGDHFLLLAEKVMAAFSEASQPGNWLVDLIPWLRYIPDWTPGATFKKKAAEWSKLHMEVIEGPYIWAKKNQDSSKLITPNVTTTVLSQQIDSLLPEDENILLWATASLFGAMALHPDVQRKGQQEVDTVLRGQRLPKIADLPSLPFVETIMREVLRWNPVTPLGVPHLLTQEDNYRTYTIPKGTIVMPNIW